jgi:hypothetical protein
MNIPTARRLGAAALGGSLLVAGLAVGAAPAQAHDEPDALAKTIGANWLNGRLDDGLLHAAYAGGSGPVTYVDHGGTVEAAYALDAVGRARLLPRITDALEGTVDSYVTGADFGAPDDTYAGPTGKLLAFAAELGDGSDPAAFGGTDLIALMEAMTTDSGGSAGRIVDDAPLDYANVYGQIWAARGLLAVGSPEASTAVDFLLSQQCADGHFRSFFTDTCGATAPGPDATAFAVVLMHDYATDGSDLAAAVDKATAWLVDWQGRRGGLADDKGVVNANSTGLAGWAFGLEGRNRAAKQAAVWLRARQVPGRGCDGKLARQRGAIAYSNRAYAQGRRNGIGALVAGEWQTAAVQALPALAHAPSTHVALAVDAPERVLPGSRPRVRIDGLAPGERACVGIGRRLVPVVGKAEGETVVVRITVAKRKGERTVRLLTANDSAIDRIVVG